MPRTAKLILLLAVVLAAALRLPSLSARPMHADEAVHADKLGTLLEGGGYVYDPLEYHGPTLYYMTLVPARLRREHRYVDLDETTLRLVPAVLGLALVALHLAARPFLGGYGAAAAALLAAISPAMVFYSRYYIHEVPLVVFSFGALLAALYYLRRPDAGSAVLAGVCAGLMLATKETAPIALGSMLLALALSDVVGGRYGDGPLHRRVQGRHVVTGAAAALVTAALLFSSFLSHPRGVVDAVRAYGLYLHRASAATWHVHPWDYYLRLLLHFPAEGTPFWTEGAILALAAVGAAAAWRREVPGADARILRLLAFYTATMLFVYSAVPYKTPWCLLGFLHGMILLAGLGAVLLVRAARPAALRAAVVLVLAAAISQLGWQAFAGSFRFASDPRNPYVYAHTSPDVLLIADRVKALVRLHPDGARTAVQVVSRENLWPLPWYLRGVEGVQWWNGVSDQAKPAPVILVGPEMEPALVRRLYDVPPPGERELYVSIFERPMELRPGVELRGYAASSLWEAFQRSDAAAHEGAPGSR